MNKITLRIDGEYTGRQIKYILRTGLALSASLTKKIKNQKGIKLNGKDATVVEICREGDLLEIYLPDEKSEGIVPTELPLNIIYEDEYILAVNKPKDMPTHPSIGNFHNTLGNACMYYYRYVPFVFRPVNRLDRDTTGIVIIAKDARVAANLSGQMQNSVFHKTYYAITEGIPSETSGKIDAPISRDENTIIKRKVTPGGQKAITKYKVIDTYENKALLEIELETGRTHQIRVHMSYIGIPLLYDYMYGQEVEGETLFLHCGKVEFLHPGTGEKVTLSCPAQFPFFKT